MAGNDSQAPPAKRALFLISRDASSFRVMLKRRRDPPRIFMPQQLTYRKVKGDIYWHLYQDCKYWPTENYQEVTSEHSPYGAFCADCLHKHMEEFRAKCDEFFSKCYSK